MRKVYSLVIVLLCAGMVHAQKASYFSGIKAGVNVYTLDKEQIAGTSEDMRIGVHGGFFFHVPLTSLFSIQPELLYSAEGIKTSWNEEKTKTTLHYLNLPVMFQLTTSSGFYAETGPQLGILIQGKSKTEKEGNETVLALNTLMKKTAFAWGLGAGYRKDSYGLSARYNYGISNLAVDETQPESKSMGFQVSLSYWIKQ